MKPGQRQGRGRHTVNFNNLNKWPRKSDLYSLYLDNFPHISTDAPFEKPLN